MAWEFKNDRPIYLQIMEEIVLRIVSGVYKAGDKLPSVRDMAAEAGVNPNTMQKAFTELERDNIVYVQRTSGRFITEDQSLIDGMRKKLATTQISLFLDGMRQLGYSHEDTINLFKNFLKEEE